MQTKQLYWSALFALGVYLAIDFYRRFTKPSQMGTGLELLDVAVGLVTLFLFAGILSLLIAIIPNQNRSYSQRLKNIFPIGLLAVTVLMSISLALYSGKAVH